MSGRYIRGVTAGFVIVPAASAAWVIDALAPRLRHLDGQGLDPEVFATLVDLKRAALDFRANCRPVAVDGPSPADAAQSTCGVVEAAEQLEISPRAVRLAAQQGRLHGEITGSGWRFTTTAVEDFTPRRRRSA